MKRKILTWFFDRWYTFRPPEMVKWWMTAEAVPAKVTEENGQYVMHIQGEKYPFPGFPRGHLLYGHLSKLKHEIKNKIFNESWALLEKGEDPVPHIKDVLDEILDIGYEQRHDVLPYERLSSVVKEVHRAFSVAILGHPQEEKLAGIRDILCHILQEDDSYRWRVQWISQFIRPNSWWRKLTGRTALQDMEYALGLLEHAEVVDDMKGRQRLLRRILLHVFRDKGINTLFNRFAHELDWKKLKLTKAEKYYFRAKYFKVDYDKFNY